MNEEKKIQEIQNCLEQDRECKESGQLIFEREKRARKNRVEQAVINPPAGSSGLMLVLLFSGL